MYTTVAKRQIVSLLSPTRTRQHPCVLIARDALNFWTGSGSARLENGFTGRARFCLPHYAVQLAQPSRSGWCRRILHRLSAAELRAAPTGTSGTSWFAFYPRRAQNSPVMGGYFSAPIASGMASKKVALDRCSSAKRTQLQPNPGRR